MGGLELGGQETTVMDFYRCIDRTKVQFDFLITIDKVNHFEPEALSLGAHIYRRPMRTKNPIMNAVGLIRVLRKNRDISIVHIHNKSSVVAVDVLLAKLCGIKVRIVHSRNTAYTMPAIHKIFQLLLGMTTTHFVGCSTEAGVSLFGLKTWTRKKPILMPNARRLTHYQYDPERRSKARAHNRLGDRFTLLHVARLTHQKNQRFLLELFAGVVVKNNNVVLIIVGDGELMRPLKAKAVDLGLGDYVRFLGQRNDIPDLMQAADIFILPSLNEGLPGVAIEAQAAGLPCLLSDTITPEVKLTPNVKFIPITQGIEPWVSGVLAYINFIRYDTIEDVRRAGYEVRDAAVRLQSLYLSPDSWGLTHGW
jgi:glycosyltransferase involved in cell wall biosynthesis